MPFLWHLPFGVCCCFCLSVSYHSRSESVVFHQTTVHNNRCLPNHQSILHGVIAFTSEQTLLSHPHFPSLPASFGGELFPIYVSSSCDTSGLVIGWWLCFLGVVRGPLSLDNSWYPHSSGQYILYTIHFKPSDLSLEWSYSLSDQDFFHFMSPYLTIHTCAFWNHHNPLACLREGELKEWCKRSFLDQSYFIGFNLVVIVLIIELFIYLSRNGE